MLIEQKWLEEIHKVEDTPPLRTVCNEAGEHFLALADPSGSGIVALLPLQKHLGDEVYCATEKKFRYTSNTEIGPGGGYQEAQVEIANIMDIIDG